MSIFDKWDNEINAEQMKKDIAEVEANGGGDYKEVPVGEYEVKIEKIELKESKNHKPMVSVQFRIIEGEFKKSCLFMNQVIEKPFQISIMNSFLRSLDSGVEVNFESYSAYNELILDVKEAIDHDKLSYSVKYGEKNGYNTFKITEVFAD